MEEVDSVQPLSRKELRKQKLMEYLAAKGKLKLPNSTKGSSLHADFEQQKATKTAQKVAMGKENKAPTDRLKWQSSRGETFVPQRSQDPPRRREFALSDKVNVRDGKQNVVRPSSNRVSAQPKVNPMLRKTYTVLPSKANSTLSSTLKKQPDPGTETISKVQPNAHFIHGAKSNSKSILCPAGAMSRPLEMTNTRISIGPLIKTKTGLVPAVIQPRNEKSNSSDPRGTKQPSFTAKRVQCSMSSSVSVHHRPVLMLSSDSRPMSKTEAQNKSKLKPVPHKQTQLAVGHVSAAPSKFKATTVKPEQRALTGKSGQSTERYVKQRSEMNEKKYAQSVKVEASTVSRTSIKASSTSVKTKTQTVVSKGRGQTQMKKEMQRNMQKTSRILPVPAPTKCTAAARVSQTAPQPSRSISVINQPAAMKTPKAKVKVVPQTEGKKQSSAQKERMRKLQEWRESKGISYKRPPMPVKPSVKRTVSVPQPFWASMKLEDDVQSLISAVDTCLTDCIKLLAEGCPPEQVKDVVSRLPAVSQKFAKYWIFQARLMEREGNLDILPMFEEAVGVILEPVDELRTVVFDILKRKDKVQDEEQKDDFPSPEASPDDGNNPLRTPKPVRILVEGERGDSSVVKYKVTATPGGPSSRQNKPVRVNGQEVRFFTPVRRSVRIERASLRYPSSLQDHDVCVSLCGDSISEGVKENNEEQSSEQSNKPLYFYRENEALGDKVSVKLILDDSF
ncbi:cytoskeleton-associated protein 2-like [Cyprinodon tularosa]|uniref:cytoskeleton-associated protein 2-like n=1 Tax=Cyprinodon tularosa TaxID=77115 RepID=UPI0018E201AA|nr:cytoskeleton-associated protein 2-like [Cyprinodon tularosa]